MTRTKLEELNVKTSTAVAMICSSRQESAPYPRNFRDESERTHPATRDCYDDAAFTIIELLVVLATIAVLAALLLPALAGTQSQSKVTACAARFRQWAASANLYANDNRGWLPSFNPAGSGESAWDVGTNLLNALYPYGMDVPDWFCPMRPAEWDNANAWAHSNLSHPIQNSIELTRYLTLIYPGECRINDNYWVPRSQSGTSFPTDYSIVIQSRWPPFIKQGMPTCALYGWPQRLHDIAVPYVPFVSDLAGSGNGGGLISPIVGTQVSDISPNTAHYVNGVLIGVNLAFADGHVSSHSPSQIRCVYFLSGSGPFWFY